MNISIVIPVYNEAKLITSLISYLQKHGGTAVSQIIVVDGGSTDDTQLLATSTGALVIQSPKKGRAAQMNYGASMASGHILYFIHADTLPPTTFVADILQAVRQGYDLGRYKTKFISSKPILRLNEWFTRFDFFICMGGDQTLFIKKDLFETLHGFSPHMLIMEEYEFCMRARQQGRYIIMKGAAQVSARKYEKNSWLDVQLANYTIVNMYKRGASQEAMVQEYKKRLKL